MHVLQIIYQQPMMDNRHESTCLSPSHDRYRNVDSEVSYQWVLCRSCGKSSNSQPLELSQQMTCPRAWRYNCQWTGFTSGKLPYLGTLFFGGLMEFYVQFTRFSSWRILQHGKGVCVWQVQMFVDNSMWQRSSIGISQWVQGGC